jgi:YHS domain-containing protein
MAGYILRIILFLIVVRLIWRFVRGVLEGAGYFQPPSHPSVGLVRDPVCGVFVVPTNALTAGSGLDTRYFCSEQCRSEWRRSKAS